jgi:hypothetical protein
VYNQPLLYRERVSPFGTYTTLLTHCTLVCRFYPSEVKKHAEDVINEILSQSTEYDEDTCYQFTLDITNGIKDRVKGACRVWTQRTTPPGPGCLWQ